MNKKLSLALVLLVTTMGVAIVTIIMSVKPVLALTPPFALIVAPLAFLLVKKQNLLVMLRTLHQARKLRFLYSARDVPKTFHLDKRA